MSTNDRLVGHLECYMDNLVDCFEEFVKKSMLVISVAVGSLVLMVMYVVKLMSERAANRQLTNVTVHTECNDRSSQVTSLLSLKESKSKDYPLCENADPVLVNCVPSIEGPRKQTASSKDIHDANASFDETFMQEFELCAISKPCESCKQTQVSEDLKSARPVANSWMPLQSYLSKGCYLRTCAQKMPPRIHQVSRAPSMVFSEVFTKTAQDYVWTAYCAMSGNYIAVATVVVVLILSFLLPDISQKLHATQDLKSIKKVLDKMSNEVKRAEVACLTVADEICYLQRNMNDDTTETSKEKLQDLSACTSRCMRLTQSEPVQAEKRISLFRRIFYPNRNTSNKEVTLMSYVYTDSFDDKNKTEQEQPLVI